MPELQFEDEKNYERQTVREGSAGFTGLVLKSGLVKNEQQAQYVLLGFAFVAILFSVYLILPKSFGKTAVKPPPGAELLAPNHPNI